MSEDLEFRKRVTFEQAEGLSPMPRQLALKEVSKELRARLWKVIYGSLCETATRPDYSKPRLGYEWRQVLEDWHVEIRHEFLDTFSPDLKANVLDIRDIFDGGQYGEIFGFIQFVLRHPYCPVQLAHEIQEQLEQGRAAYRVFEGPTIAPIASEAEGQAIGHAFADMKEAEFTGARTHLRNAASLLTQGRWADSVRESMHSVESVVRLLGKSSSVSEALKKLSAAQHVNPNMSAGLGRLYNYTSDEDGIRHALLEDGDAKVDEADALFMFGACAAFVTYLISKGRGAGLVGRE